MSAIHDVRQQASRDLLLRELTIARSALHETRAQLASLRRGVERLPVWTVPAGVRADRPTSGLVSLDDVRALLEDQNEGGDEDEDARR